VKKQNPDKNKSRPARMVLLENFGTEPITAKLGGSNGSRFVCLLLPKVTQPVTPGVPKFRKESHPERARGYGITFILTITQRIKKGELAVITANSPLTSMTQGGPVVTHTTLYPLRSTLRLELSLINHAFCLAFASSDRLGRNESDLDPDAHCPADL
jgi:hypothetical protein